MCSSICMNLVAWFLNSSMFLADLLIKLSENRPGRIVETRWCMSNSGIKFLIAIQTLLNLSMNAHKDSPFSCFTLRRYMDEVWCGRLVAYYMMDFVVRTLKIPMELGGSPVNRPSGPPWRNAGKTLHLSALLVV